MRKRGTPGALLMLVTLVACTSSERVVSEPAQEQAPSSATRWTAALPAINSEWLDYPARVLSSPNDSALVTPPLTGRVLHVRVHPGQTVQAGDALVDLVMPELIQAAGALRSSELRLVSWNERRARLVPLLEKGLARAAELNEIDSAIASVRAERESARATLRAAGEPDQRAASLLDGNGAVSLRAPLTGVVVSVSAKPGEIRAPAAGPLLELVASDTDPTVEARFSALPPQGSSFEWLAAGAVVPLSLEALSPHADERDGSRTAWFHVANGQPGLVAGSLGRVRIVAGADWVLVPARALRTIDGVLTVQVQTAEGGRAVPVTLIQQNASDAVIRGVAAGTSVAADAARVSDPG